jgi:hypothetical protein
VRRYSRRRTQRYGAADQYQDAPHGALFRVAFLELPFRRRLRLDPESESGGWAAWGLQMPPLPASEIVPSLARGMAEDCQLKAIVLVPEFGATNPGGLGTQGSVIGLLVRHSTTNVRSAAPGRSKLMDIAIPHTVPPQRTVPT